ncbi:Hypothetical predicted protein, partial [Mytilus galloprovincialis]
AFTATLPTGPHCCAKTFPRVKYSEIKCADPGYDPVTGTFTVAAGMAGKYLVSVTMMTGTAAGHLQLIKNAPPAYVWLYTGNEYDMATQTVCMDLVVGDQVWVQPTYWAMYLFDVYNTFTVIKFM